MVAATGVRKAASVAIVAPALAILAVGCSSGTDHSEDPPLAGNTGEPVVVAAGDIASCGSRGDEATAELLAEIDSAIVVALGDEAYENGSAENFRECYDPSWGRFKDRTLPVPGNHEYMTEGAEGYFGYFGEAAGDSSEGYYSYEFGGWHVVALNSNKCMSVIGCHILSQQIRWLKANLADDDKTCTLAYFHHPLFTSGKYRPGVPEVRPLWEALYNAGADVVLSAHDHNYQRFAPQDPDGRADPERGIRQFVVGTGGRSHYQIESPLPNSEVHTDDTYGVLKLTLRPKGYDWRFVPVDGATFSDSGHDQCH